MRHPGVGQGSVLATAWEEASPGLLAECLLAPEDTQAALVLGQGLAAAGEWDFLPPADAGLTVPALSPSQEEARRACLDRAAALREEKRLAREEARPAPPTGEGARVWQSLTEKDREGELSPQLLEDALAAFAWEGQYPAKAFQEGLPVPPGGAGGAHPLAPAAGGALLPPGAGGRPPRAQPPVAVGPSRRPRGQGLLRRPVGHPPGDAPGGGLHQPGAAGAVLRRLPGFGHPRQAGGRRCPRCGE